MNTNKLFDIMGSAQGEMSVSEQGDFVSKLVEEDDEDEEDEEDDEDDDYEDDNEDEEEAEWDTLPYMNDVQIEKYVELIGRCPREECDEWTMDYEGGDILRYSYVNFADKNITDQKVNDITITRAIFVGTKLMNCVFDNVRFDECNFKNVVLENVTFNNSMFVECELDPRMTLDNSCTVENYCEEDEQNEQDNELLSKYSEEQQNDLRGYAQTHELTIAEAIEYQTHCHSCGREVDNDIFDEVNHQYCRQRCFDYCEEYWYPCFREANCRVCCIWQYHENRRQQEIRSNEVAKQSQVLMAIEVFKELQVYGSLLACVPDLSEYFV